MSDENRSIREKCYAKVVFHDGNIPGYVRDISESGCRIDILEKTPWDRGELKKFSLFPEHMLHIGPIHGTLEIRWTRSEKFFLLMGTKIKSVKDETSKKNYNLLLDYYKKLAKDR